MAKQLTRSQRLHRDWNNYLFDHPVLKFILEWGYAALLAALSAFAFGFGFVMFIQGHGSIDLVTGGVGGVSQIIYISLKLGGLDVNFNDITSLGYTVINIPIIIFAFKHVGVRFSIFTTINVLLSSLFLKVVPTWGFVQELVQNELVVGSEITRALFAGLCTGISSGLAFKGLFSTGGFDVISYYISNRSNTSTGKYIVSINICIVCTYTILNIGYLLKNGKNWTDSIAVLLYVGIYLVIVSLVVDLINTRNKKVHLQIITEYTNMPSLLIANFPHSSTVVNGRGSYSKRDKLVIVMAVSSTEVKKVTKLVRMADPLAFIEVTPIIHVYGKFYVDPIK